MRTYFVIIIFTMGTALECHPQSEFISRIVEFHPAPGQFINTPAWGTPQRAESLVGGVRGGISLGGYGGYIVVDFDHTIENHPDNPYGVDFTVFGNPLVTGGEVTWAEPGIVMVMRDENGNGKADDTWYELAGSDHYFSTTIKNYGITYINPGQPRAVDVPWTDNRRQTGFVFANSFHRQPYYPSEAHFPAIERNEISFTGTLLKSKVDLSNPDFIRYYSHGFGYVDNVPVGEAPYTVPDNPYTRAIEGSGGDAFDIDWAVDSHGDHVHLAGIDFIKIYTAVNADAAALGEISTEIRGIADVAPNKALTGQLRSVAVADVPRNIEVETVIRPEAYAFYQGKLQPDEVIVWSVNDDALAEIDENGFLTARAPGEVILTAALQSDPSVRDEVSLDIISPSAIDIVIATATIRVNTRQEITALVKDRQGAEIPGLPVAWRSSDTSVLGIESEDGRPQVAGKAIGEAWLVVNVPSIPALSDSLLIQVLPEASARRVYITIKDQQESIIRRRLINVSNFDINPYVEDRSKNYGIDALTEVTTAHVIARLFENEAFVSDLRFRDDEHGDGQLYLWRVPKGDASVVTYVYGFGGSSQPNHRGAWLVKVNERTYVHDLDQVKIGEGDEVVVYHIADTSEPWKFSQVTSDTDTVSTAEPVMIRASWSSHSFDGDREIATERSGPVSDEIVYVNGIAAQKDGDTIRTDETGHAELTFEQGGLKEIRVNNEWLFIFVKGDFPVSVPEVEKHTLSLGPNPASTYIRLISKQHPGPFSYEVIDMRGNMTLKGHLRHEKIINIEKLGHGLHYLVIRHASGIETLKFIKQ